MKNIIPLVFLLSAPFIGQGQATQLKVISYNILNGFDWGKDTTREAQLIAWMNTQQPDVAADGPEAAQQREAALRLSHGDAVGARQPGPDLPGL